MQRRAARFLHRNKATHVSTSCRRPVALHARHPSLASPRSTVVPTRGEAALMKVLIFGATGMVGQGVLRECLLDPKVTD
ncbi:hypothetical protein ACIPIA_12745, partial [Bosea sp. CER48]